jgi:hypothetical protein
MRDIGDVLLEQGRVQQTMMAASHLFSASPDNHDHLATQIVAFLHLRLEPVTSL